MKKNFLLTLMSLAWSVSMFAAPLGSNQFPWDNGPLKVSDNGRYLVHENGQPFFWLGETAWLLTSRLQREEVDFYLKDRAKKGFNVIQISVFHYYPQYNVYGECATPNGYDFKKIDVPGRYGYWDHVDYVIDAAAARGMYIGLVCTWGSEVVKGGKMTVEEAKKYGRFLAERYKDKPNIIWLIGGDVSPEANMDVWNALATTIKSIDKNHLMTYHPVGRTCSDQWFHEAEWLDFNMFQSGHRRYGQNFGQTENYPIEQGTEEDNWRYVMEAYSKTPVKPVIDGEPSYEAIPQGLRSGDEPYWNDDDVRRYAYWSVFAGSFGHTYGHNSVMQFYVPSIIPSFFPTEPWYEGIQAPGAAQMHYLKDLMCVFPFTEGQPDQSLIVGEAGAKHDRLIATRGKDYAMVYTWTNKQITIDLDKISGVEKQVFWFSPKDGSFAYVGKYAATQTFVPEGGYGSGKDKVLVAFDAAKSYMAIPEKAVRSGQVLSLNEAALRKSDEDMLQKAAEWAASLQLNNPAKENRVAAVIATHLKAIRDWHNSHVNTVPAGTINPWTGQKLSSLDREIIADSGIPGSVRQALLDGLRADLTEAQVEAVLDKYTVGKVEFTMNGYRSIVPDMTPEDEAFLYKNLKEARLNAIDYKNMKEISGIFEIYKTKNEQYFTQSGRDWKTMYKAYVEKRKTEKAAAQKQAQ